MTSRFFKRIGYALGCCIFSGALVVSVADGQGRGRGGMKGGPGGGGGHRAEGVLRELPDRASSTAEIRSRGRYEGRGVPRGPVVDAPRWRNKAIHRLRHDNRNPYPGTPRRRRVRRGYHRHTHGR